MSTPQLESSTMMVSGTTLLDQLMPAWDATRVEHRVIDAPAPDVYHAVVHADFLDAMRHHRGVRVLVGIRTAMERLVTVLRRRAWHEPPAPDRLRIADLPRRGEWILLGDDPPREVAFGVIGRFWAGETEWRTTTDSEFAAFDQPGFAKIACHLLLRELPDARTLLSYEARTRATDDASRRAFLRYWRAASPFVGIVMRSLLAVVDRDTAHPQPAASGAGNAGRQDRTV